MTKLSVRDLKKIYQDNTEAISNFSIDLNDNEFISIVGPSGCGKSTILSIIDGLIDKTDGEINLYNSTIGYMFQEDNLFSFRSILSNCLLGLEVEHKLDDESINYVKKLLKEYGLKNFINKYPSNLSGGMRQRCALIRTLAIKPDILLLDEPFSALDYQTRLRVSNDVYNIIKKEKKSVIMVTHDVAEAVSMSDKVIVLTKRPCKIKNIYDIKLYDKKDPISNRKDKLFNYYYDLIWKDIDINED